MAKRSKLNEKLLRDSEPRPGLSYQMFGTEVTRGKWRTVEVLACPVTFSPHPHQIDSARRAYDDWWQALGWIRDGLIAGRMLREVEVTAAKPKVRPWELRPPGRS